MWICWAISFLLMMEKANKYKIISFILIAVNILLIIVLLSIMAGTYSKLEKNMENKITDTAVLETNYGVVKIKLYLNETPVTAGNFKKLVESGYYDGTKFHRVIKNFMIQGGDPLTKNDSMVNRWGTGGPGYAIDDEFVKGFSNVRGTISMANSGPNSGGSQFFINVVNNTPLDYDKQPLSSKHPVFGVVVEGMDVVDTISVVKTGARDMPAQPVVIQKAYME